MPPRISRGPLGVGIFNQPSPLARQIWYYLRAIGRAKHAASFRHEHHDEDGYLLHYVVRGAVWHELRQRRCVTRAGEACLLDTAEKVTYGVAGPGQAEFYWALFNGKEMPRVFAELHADHEPVFDRLDTRRVSALWRDLMAVIARQPPAYEARASGLLGCLLAELFASRPPLAGFMAPEGQTAPLSETVRKGMELVGRFYDQRLPIKHVASVAGENLSAFSRRFHREMGMTPSAYLQQYRIEQAKRLLESSAKSVAEIARSVGLPDPNYFARVFTQLTGVSPRQYRKQRPRK